MRIAHTYHRSLLMAPEGGDAGTGAGGGAKPAGDGKPTEKPATDVKTEPVKTYEAEFKAAEKRADKTAKDLADFKALVEKPEFAVDMLRKMVGGGKEEDPVAKFNAAQAAAKSATDENAQLRLQNAIYRAAGAAKAKDPDDHFAHAQARGLKHDDAEGIKAFFAERKKEKDYLFHSDEPEKKAAPGAGSGLPKQPNSDSKPGTGAFRALLPHEYMMLSAKQQYDYDLKAKENQQRN